MAIFDFLRSLWRKVFPGSTDDYEFVAAEPDRPADVAADAADAADGWAEQLAAAVDDELDAEIVGQLDDAIGAAFGADAEPTDVATDAVEDADADAELLGAGVHPADMDDAAARELFAGIASNYSRPVKNFIFELQRGTATKDWIEICIPVMSSIIDGAESLDLRGVAQCMTDFQEALALADESEGRTIDDDSRTLILSCYEELVDILPDTFRLPTDDRRRESIIIHSLLRQIPQVGHVTFEKLYAAGLTSLEALFTAQPAELASVSGVSEWLCELICDKARDHRTRIEGASTELAQVDHRARLVELLKDLRRYQEEFHRASVAEDDPEAVACKRECLRHRQVAALKINVALAEMGEIDMVEALRRMSIERRIERLESYVGTAQAGVVVTPDHATDSVQQIPGH
jgi:hypothetical protein